MEQNHLEIYNSLMQKSNIELKYLIFTQLYKIVKIYSIALL